MHCVVVIRSFGWVLHVASLGAYKREGIFGGELVDFRQLIFEVMLELVYVKARVEVSGHPAVYYFL